MSNKSIGVVGAFMLVAVLGSCSAGYQYGTRDNVTFTVTDKDRIVTGSGEDTSSKYLVWTENSTGKDEVFENIDAWLSGKFASSDVQGQLKVGKEYNAVVYGWRIPLISQYRNIVSVKPVGQ